MSKPAESANPRTTNISPHECNFRTAGATFRDGDGDSGPLAFKSHHAPMPLSRSRPTSVTWRVGTTNAAQPNDREEKAVASDGRTKIRSGFGRSRARVLRVRDSLAEGVGFEPTNDFRRCRFSRPVPSTARPPLRARAPEHP
jgi:hypothetical protein